MIIITQNIIYFTFYECIFIHVLYHAVTRLHSVAKKA